MTPDPATRPAITKHTGNGSCHVYIRDADALYAELLSKGANVQGEPLSRPWGFRDFAVLDLEGNRITFRPDLRVRLITELREGYTEVGVGSRRWIRQSASFSPSSGAS